MHEKETWVEHNFENYLSPDVAVVYWALPEHVRKGLAEAALGVYNRGFNHGRSYAGCGIEPVYYVAENHLEIAVQSTDIA